VDGSERVLGSFELRGTLGRGAMAVVWRAYDTSLDREVAIKEPSLPPGGDDAVRAEFARRFVREARAAARLNHPGIVTIHSASLDEGRPLIVMELVEGPTLRRILDTQTLTAAQTYALLEQLLAATAYAHERGVIHRDLKPDNVFVTPGGTVKLADFGIAHVGDAGTTLTAAGTLLGTPAYMAPEQIRGEPVDARCDVFALGVIAYECLAGRNPFGATGSSHYAAIFHRILDEPVPPLVPSEPADPPHAADSAGQSDPAHAAVPTRPADPAIAPLAGVVLRALEKDRDKRYQSAAEMLAAWRAAFPGSVDAQTELAALSLAAGGPPAHATEVATTAVAEEVQTQAEDDAATHLAVSAVAAAPAGGAPKPAGADRARTRRRLLIAIAAAVCVVVVGVGVFWAVDRDTPDEGGGAETGASTASASPSPSDSVSRSEMRDYVSELDQLLRLSSGAREDVRRAVESYFDGTLPKVDTMGALETVILNREDMLRRLLDADVPRDAKAEECYRRFQKAMVYSKRADESYLASVDKSLDEEATWKAAKPDNTQAAEWKTKLMDIYNPLASDFGLRHDWTKDDF